MANDGGGLIIRNSNTLEAGGPSLAFLRGDRPAFAGSCFAFGS